MLNEINSQREKFVNISVHYLMIGCIEEVAYKNGWIDKEQLLELAEPLQKTDYGKYLMEIAGEENVI